MLEELQRIIGELYDLYGVTDQVIKLSQIVHKLTVEYQNNNEEDDKEC